MQVPPYMASYLSLAGHSKISAQIKNISPQIQKYQPALHQHKCQISVFAQSCSDLPQQYFYGFLTRNFVHCKILPTAMKRYT